MKLHSRKISFLLIASALVSFTAIKNVEQITGEHDAIYWAEMLVSHLDAQNTSYRHKETNVTWAGSNGATTFAGHTDCSGFINSLFAQTYGWDENYFKSWLGKSRPLACHYYDAIAAENHFKKISKINAIQPGDLIAIKYNDRSEHEDNTGHCLLVVKKPEHHNPSAPEEPGTDQYEITIIDCSKSPHGKNDTRYSPDGSAYPGVGKGVFRLYADSDGNVKGYSWSTLRPKPVFDPFENPILIGRIQ